MMRRRSYKEFDYGGVSAVEAYYDDGKEKPSFDKWEDIVEAFKKSEEIILKRSHGDVRKSVGMVKYWDLDKINKKAYIGFNKEDLDDDIEFAEFNLVSIAYDTNSKGKIIGVNHICIGDTFIPKCPKEVCNIVKQRGDEPDTTTDVVDVPDKPDTTTDAVEKPVVPEETTESDIEEISNKILMEEIGLLKKKIEEMSKVEDEPEPEPEVEGDKKIKDEKIKLGFQEKLKHNLPSSKNEPKSGFTKWKFV